jgi:hypothetical protein
MVDTPIVSESLQKDFRDNFPSQVNSGRDLHVSDVIVPVVDFSASTAISGLEVSMQQAYDFNSTSFNITNTTTTIVNTTGFWKISAMLNGQGLNSTIKAVLFMDDGSTTKEIVDMNVHNGGAGPNTFTSVIWNGIIFLKSGVELKGITNSLAMNLNGICRQVADISGTLVNPDGYTGS